MDDGCPPASLGARGGLTRFVGRGAEIAELEDTLGRARLVTLVGAPGCGKSRLGVEVAAAVGGRFRDGVRFVELAPVADAALVVNVVATALGVREEPGRPRLETLTEMLASAELLVVMDNCEHVVDAVTELVEGVLVSCPGVRVLSTSRVALGLAGEQVWRVPPLDQAAAVELFTDRAGLIGTGFRADGASRSLVEEICQRLAGLPLAIELAAAWVRVLTPGQILERLSDALPLLRSEIRGVSGRQRTMEATVDWSCQLLDPFDRELFDRISGFAGGFDLAAATAILGPVDGVQLDRAGGADDAGDEVLRSLTSLVDHSLVLTSPPDEPGQPMRYRVLEPLRQCGAARLADRGETDVVRRRHAEYYLRLASRFEAELIQGRLAPALGRLEQEHGNLVAALAWARGHDRALGLRMATALAHFWHLQGRVNEGRAWLEELLGTGRHDAALEATALARTTHRLRVRHRRRR